MEQNRSWVANSPQLGMIFPACYGSLRFITVLTTARQLFLSWATSVQSTPFQPISSTSIAILCFHLRMSLPSGFLPCIFPTKILYTPLLSPIRTHAPLVSSFFWLPEKYLVRITDYGAPHYAFFSSPLLPPPCIYEIVFICRQEGVWFFCIYTGSSSVYESMPSAGWRK